MIKSQEEIRAMLDKLRTLEQKAPQYLKESYQHAGEVLEWVLGTLEEEDVIAFGE